MKNPIAWRQTALVTVITAQLAACSLVVEAFEADVDPGGEGIDAGSGDVVCEGWAVHPNSFDPCSFIEPTGSLDLRNGSWVYDTSTGILRSPGGMDSTPTSELRGQAGADDIRVLSVTDLRISESASLRAVGAYPLLVLSFDGIDVEGQLSVASTSESAGAGANSPLCGLLAGRPGRSDDDIGSGGGGGSLRAVGGDGGDADTYDGSATRGGSGGTGGVILTSFRGGCSGGIGGASAGGQPGSGGGGLLLMARNLVRVSGQIGAGGQGALATPGGRGGGGGGGSGGIIAINAEQVRIESGAVVASNGGGGAEGSDEDPGRNGDDAQLSSQPAFGGNGDGSEGAGGQGGAGAEPAGLTGGVGYYLSGGGGGGGSAGVVIISAAMLDVAPGAVMSPAFTTP